MRDGKEVLTTYTGTVPGDGGRRGASRAPTRQATFDATFTLTDDDRLDKAVLTGPFYPDADDVTYTITFDDYGTDEGHHRPRETRGRQPARSAQPRCLLVAGRGRGRLRGRRHLRRGAGAAGHDGRRRAGRSTSCSGRRRSSPGFLLGYVAVLPLIGRIADLRGRLPGAGRLAGGLRPRLAGHRRGVRPAEHGHRPVPAGRRRRRPGARRRWPWSPTSTRRRGAACRSASSARCRSSAASSARCTARWCSPSPTGRRSSRSTSPSAWCSPPPLRVAGARRGDASRPLDLARPALLALAGLRRAGAASWCSRPALTSDVTLGLAFVPVAGESRWLTPVGIAPCVVLRRRCSPAASPRAGRWSTCAAGRRWPGEADLLGAGCCSALALAGVILAFATADPEVSVFSPAGPWLLPAPPWPRSRFWLQRSAPPPAGAARRARGTTPAWGALRGQLLRRRRADRRAGRHPDLRPGHGLPRLPARRRAGAGAAAGGPAGRRARSAATLIRRLPTGVVTAAGMAARRRRLRVDVAPGG